MSDEVIAVPAASVIVLRDAPLEVLMMRRHAQSSFMPDAWVFPGGVAEQIDNELADGEFLSAMRYTGVRETFEETGVWLGAPLDDAEHKRKRLLAGSLTLRHLVSEAPVDLESLVWTSRWITPVGVPKRFDTYFFLARVPRDVVASAEQQEGVDVTWIRAADALARHAAGEMKMVFPTLRTLESLRAFEDAGSLIDSRRGVTIEPIQPVLVNGKPTLP
ncbi:MAG TPA: NUDIX domain-containing protein [Thermoanaerobaculia bacterium]|nr:NUDIX domain-containing protein [Thermoanaerobaculia bacterium]